MRRPEFIARQGGRPSGVLGRLVALVMERETLDINYRVASLLDIKQGDRVLDVGTGNGASLRHLAQRASDGLVVGVDHSEVMCRRARKNNSVLLANGRGRVEYARSDNLPFATGMFDAAMSVHTLYFWQPAGPHFREIARVLRPRGQLVIAFRDDKNPATRDFPASVYSFRSPQEVEELLASSGFGEVTREQPADLDDDIAIFRATRNAHG